MIETNLEQIRITLSRSFWVTSWFLGRFHSIDSGTSTATLRGVEVTSQGVSLFPVAMTKLSCANASDATRDLSPHLQWPGLRLWPFPIHARTIRILRRMGVPPILETEREWRFQRGSQRDICVSVLVPSACPVSQPFPC